MIRLIFTVTVQLESYKLHKIWEKKTTDLGKDPEYYLYITKTGNIWFWVDLEWEGNKYFWKSASSYNFLNNINSVFGFFFYLWMKMGSIVNRCAYLSFQTLKIFVKTNVHKYIQIVFATLSLNLNGWLILLPKANVQSGFIVFNNHFVIITCIYINTCISSGVIGWFILLHIILHLTASCC